MDLVVGMQETVLEVCSWGANAAGAFADGAGGGGGARRACVGRLRAQVRKWCSHGDWHAVLSGRKGEALRKGHGKGHACHLRWVRVVVGMRMGMLHRACANSPSCAIRVDA